MSHHWCGVSERMAANVCAQVVQAGWGFGGAAVQAAAPPQVAAPKSVLKGEFKEGGRVPQHRPAMPASAKTHKQAECTHSFTHSPPHTTTHTVHAPYPTPPTRAYRRWSSRRPSTASSCCNDSATSSRLSSSCTQGQESACGYIGTRHRANWGPRPDGFRGRAGKTGTIQPCRRALGTSPAHASCTHKGCVRCQCRHGRKKQAPRNRPDGA